MERHFGFPLVITAAFHGALLFGFNGGERSKPPVSTPTMITACELMMPPEELPMAIEETATGNPLNLESDALVAPSSEAEPTGLKTMVAIPHPAPVLVSGVTVRDTFLDTSGNLLGAMTGSGGAILSSMALDDPPRARLQCAPVFPHEARRQGVSGEVVVEFVVDEEGRVLAPRVIRSSREMFEEPTLRAVAKWSFHPGRSSGRVVRFRMVVPVLFTLSG